MEISKKVIKEEIHVLHDSIDDLRNNIDKLMSEGWSDNERYSLSGLQLIEKPVHDEHKFKETYPNITVHEHEKGSFVFRGGKYAYYTTHSREIKEEL